MQNLFWFSHKKIHLCYCLSFPGKIKIFGCKFIPICQVYVKKSQVPDILYGPGGILHRVLLWQLLNKSWQLRCTDHRVLFPLTCYYLYLLAI